MNRALGAFNPFFTGTGQQLQAQGMSLANQLGAGQLGLGAGQLGLGAGQLGLGAGNLMQGGEQIQAQGRLSGLSNLTNMGLGLAPIQAGQMNQVPQGVPPPAPTSSGEGFVANSPMARWGIGRQQGGPVEGYANGGVVANQPGRSDFGDFMSNLLYGQTFNRQVPQAPPPMRVPIQQIQRSQGSQPNLQMQTMPSGAYGGGGLGLKLDAIANAQRAATGAKWADLMNRPGYSHLDKMELGSVMGMDRMI
ncbi:MAG: hypothetical protein ACYSWO_30900, partial [Planctomycetota bacterium]